MGCLKYSLEPPVRTDTGHYEVVSNARILLNVHSGKSGDVFVIYTKTADSDNRHQFYIDCKPQTEQETAPSPRLNQELARYLVVRINLRRSLRKLSELGENWDHYGAAAIEKAALRNMQAVIELAPATALDKWSLFPSTNGTLLLTAKGEAVGSVNVGNEGFSYALMVGGEIYSANEQAFDAQEVAKLIEELSERF